MKGKIVN